jgi:hypothetical protein
MADANIILGYELGRGLSRGITTVPAPLQDPRRLARLVDDVDCLLLVDGHGSSNWARAGDNLRAMAQKAQDAMPEVTDSLIRAGVTLRLWAGCLWAAKPLDRPHLTASERGATFTHDIDPRAATHELFRAGVEAAPAFNALPSRSAAPPSLEGVPSSSPVRRHL